MAAVPIRQLLSVRRSAARQKYMMCLKNLTQTVSVADIHVIEWYGFSGNLLQMQQTFLFGIAKVIQNDNRIPRL